MFLRDVQAAFPRLPVWVGHAGGKTGWDDALAVLSTGANSYLELSAWIWDDTSEEDQDDFALRVAKAITRFGGHRVLFGTDHVSGSRVRGREFLPYVVNAFHRLPERAKKQGTVISESDMDLLLGANAAEQLRVSDTAGAD
jgi:predicted TIM-barrel fold metal-dependent hydrolase